MPNGVAMNVSGIDYWTPRGIGKDFELSPILTPLAPFRDRLLVVGGLDHRTPKRATTARAAITRAARARG